jgi:hypothetical protein
MLPKLKGLPKSLPNLLSQQTGKNPLDVRPNRLPPIGLINAEIDENIHITESPTDTAVLDKTCNCYKGTVIDKDATEPISFTEENKLESDTYNAFNPLGQLLYRKIYREYAIRNPHLVSIETYHSISTIIFSIKILDELDYDIREYVEYYYTNIYHITQRPMIDPDTILRATDEKLDSETINETINEIKNEMINNKRKNIKGKYYEKVSNNNIEYIENKSYILPSKRANLLPSITRKGGKRKNKRTQKRKNKRSYKRKN